MGYLKRRHTGLPFLLAMIGGGRRIRNLDEPPGVERGCVKYRAAEALTRDRARLFLLFAFCPLGLDEPVEPDYTILDISLEIILMSQLRQEQYNLWDLTILCLLRLRPMHPYEMQRRIREWHKDEFLDLKRGSLYHAIERLTRRGAIVPIETTRQGRRPERTVYRLTEAGEQQMLRWLQEMLAKPLREPTQFFAALSFLSRLTPESVCIQLQQRAALLEAEIVALDAVLKTMVPRIGRLVLIEVEYARAMRQSELAWVQSFHRELEMGTLSWNPEEALRCAAALPQSEILCPIPNPGVSHEDGK
jgi:DNA-binding PadR family transcriptional regulator